MPASAQSAMLYREQTGPAVKLIKVLEEEQYGGSLLHLWYSSGESYRISSDSSRATLSFDYRDPAAGTEYSAHRSGNAIRIEGVLKGRPASRVVDIDGNPWYESLEFGLRDFAVSGSRRPALAWVIVPENTVAYLVALGLERIEPIDVSGRSVEAVRVRVSLRGIPAFFWSTLYWYRVPDGAFVKFEGPRGGFGSIPTIMELVAGAGLAARLR